jgi:ATP-dependent Clp protease ATP-binding subunit ClpC
MEAVEGSTTITITPRVSTVLCMADTIARRHGQAFVGTEHILLALLADGDGIAAQVLADIGAANEARKRTERIIDSDRYRAPTPAAAAARTASHGVSPPPLRLTVPFRRWTTTG